MIKSNYNRFPIFSIRGKKSIFFFFVDNRTNEQNWMKKDKIHDTFHNSICLFHFDSNVQNKNPCIMADLFIFLPLPDSETMKNKTNK